MRYITLLTEKVKEDAKRHGYYAEIEKLAKRIEDEQSDEMFQPYEPSFYRKRRLGSYRLICYEKIIDNCSVYCFIRVLVRSDKDYEKFLNDQSIFDDYIPLDHILKEYIKDREFIPPTIKPELKENESNFLFSTSDDIFSNNIIILESEEWVNLISSKEYEDYRLNFLRPIQQIINDTDHSKNENVICDKDNNNTRIIYKYFEKEKHLFLIAPVIHKNISEIEKYKEKYSNILRSDYEFDREELLKRSVKAYPEIITYEDDLWLRIQKSNEGNLALSPEEEEILRHINFDSGDKPKYPLFINGRAGSGKSTILIYLFTDILMRFIKSNIQNIEISNPPVFITYSDILLKNVKEYAKKLFESNSHKIADDKLKLNEGELNKILDRSFKKFEDHILELIGADSRNIYRLEKYIDFSRFKKIFTIFAEQNPDHNIRKLSPEICWHIIRTYIKGMRDNENNYMDPEGYSELPRNFKTVQFSTYKLVFDKIWKSWYEIDFMKNGYWDSQDITRALLNLDKDLASYPGIFCDEAQDFTRIELELIFKLCLFSNRELDSNHLKFIPFAFAGDPFQTLNPTGFDWNSIKANFHDKIVKPFDKFGKANLDFNFNELSYNYRSSKGIVQFSNFIQLLRGVLFKIKDLNPQKSWLKSDDVEPEFYKISDEKIYNILKEESLKGIVFIIPAQEGGDAEYIKGDNLLSNISNLRNDFSGNLLTPIMAKGLEFSRVVVYRFGQEYLDRHNFNFLEKIDEEITNPEEYLPYQYFINNLYVACSRAKKRLFIIDTEDGIKKFWCKLKDMKEDLLLKYSYMTGNNNWDDDSICEIMEGTQIDNIKKDPDNPLDLAEQFFKQGIANKDTDLLKRAKQNYKIAEHEEKVILCSALIFEFEKDYNRAADKYLELEEKESAIRCYWEGKNYTALINTGNETDPRNVASRFILKKIEATVLLNFIIDSLQNNQFKDKFLEKYFLDDKWYDIFLMMIKDLSSRENILPQVNLTICRRVDKIIEIDKRLSNTTEYGDLLFISNEFIKSIEVWDSLNLINHERYFKAKEMITDYPEKIEWQFKLKEIDAIFNYYINSNKRLDEFQNNQKDILLNVLISKDSNYLVKLLESVRDYSDYKINKDTLMRVYDELNKRNIYSLYFKLYTSNSDEDTIKSNFEKVRQSKVSNLKDLVLIFSFIDYNLKTNLLYPALNTTTFHINGNDLISDNGKLIIYKMILNAIQRQKFDPNDSEFRQLQLKIVDFVNYLKNHSFCFDDIGIEPLGACLERSGYIVPTLEFYESIIKEKNNGKYSEKQKDFAKERWVKTKDRQGASLNNNFHREKADEMFRAYMLNKKYKSIAEINEYPVLNDFEIDSDLIFEPNKHVKIKEVSSKVGIIQQTIIKNEENNIPKTYLNNENQSGYSDDFDNLFEITIKKDVSVKIRNKKSNDTSILNIKRKSMNSEIEDKKYIKKDFIIWELKDWGMWIQLEKSGQHRLKISYQKIENTVFESKLS